MKNITFKKNAGKYFSALPASVNDFSFKVYSVWDLSMDEAAYRRVFAVAEYLSSEEINTRAFHYSLKFIRLQVVLCWNYVALS